MRIAVPASAPVLTEMLDQWLEGAPGGERDGMVEVSRVDEIA